ncbi:MAG: GntR family transcriptional regulator [Firmicutes bacterium]|nr:GntR family transcriptional regulator [Bacillota bacterium]
MITDEVEAQLRELVRKLGPNRRLPSEMELSNELAVGRSTIREAIRVLEREGLLFKRHGVGTFTMAGSGPIVVGLEVLRGIPNIVRAAGQEPRIATEIIDVREAPPDIVTSLELDGDDRQVVFARQLYLGDGVPIILGDSYVPARLFSDPSVFCADVTKGAADGRCLFDVLEEHGIQVKYAVSGVQAVCADTVVAELLAVQTGHPLLLLSEVHYSDRGVPVICSRDYIESTRHSCVVVRRRI